MPRPLPEAGDFRLLIVDDTLANIALLVQLLEEQGYALAFARSGEEALRLLEQSPADLVLMDVMMPGMDGFETCRRLKAQERTRPLPVIFTTARSDSADIAEAFAAGAADYIAKPLQRDEVLARIRSQLLLHWLLKERARAAGAH